MTVPGLASSILKLNDLNKKLPASLAVLEIAFLVSISLDPLPITAVLLALLIVLHHFY